MRNAITLWLFQDPTITIVALEDASLPLIEPSADPRTVASRERLANPTDVVVVVERIERTGTRTNAIYSQSINGTKKNLRVQPSSLFISLISISTLNKYQCFAIHIYL